MNCLLTRENFSYMCRWVDPIHTSKSDIELRFLTFPAAARGKGALYRYAYSGVNVDIHSGSCTDFQVTGGCSCTLFVPGTAVEAVSAVIIPHAYWDAVSITLNNIGMSRSWDSTVPSVPVVNTSSYTLVQAPCDLLLI